MKQMSHHQTDKITAKQSLEILGIKTVRSFLRYKAQYGIQEIVVGAGKAKLYLRSEVEGLKKINNPKSYDKPQTKIRKKKIEKTIEKNAKLKEETKKDLAPPTTQTDNPTNPLNHIGQDEFNRIVEILTENGTYKEQDRALALAYAISYQKYIYAVAASAREDDTTSDQFSNLKIHPYFLVADKCLSQMTKIANILGLGVRSRIGLEIKSPKKETLFDILNSKDEF